MRVPARTAGWLLALLLPGSVLAGKADVVDVAVRCAPENRCTFAVTIRHDDEGWDHYADGFEVLTTDGEILGKRPLRHPHVNEQPFTRALQGLAIPDSVETVRVRAHDSVHGLGGTELTVTIERD